MGYCNLNLNGTVMATLTGTPLCFSSRSCRVFLFMAYVLGLNNKRDYTMMMHQKQIATINQKQIH